MTPQVIIPENYTSASFDLEIQKMKTVPSGSSKIVTEVQYRVVASEGGYTAGQSRTLTLDTGSLDSFIEYNELSQDNVKSWIETLSNYQLDKYSVCNVILDYKKDNTEETLPWE